MKIITDTIIVKSTPEYYLKESTGLKDNTARTLKSITEDGYTLDDLRACKYVIIRNPETEEQFKREISDVSPFEDIIIISWFPQLD